MIITRWLTRELAVTFLVVMLTLWFASAGARLLDYLAEAAAGEIAPAMLWAYVLNRLPKSLQVVLPVATFLAVALTVGRGYAEREWMVLETAGVSPRRLALLVMMLALLPTLALAALTLWVSPSSEARLAARSAAAARHVADELLQSGRFVEAGRHGVTVYVGHVDRKRGELSDIFIVDATATGDSLTLIRASSGRQITDLRTNAVYLLLAQGLRIHGGRDAGPVQAAHFERLRLQLPSRRGPRASSAESLPTRLLMGDVFSAGAVRPARVADVRRAGSRDELVLRGEATRAAELYWRFSLPASALLGAVLAVLLGRVPPTGGRFDRMLPAGFAFLTYFGAIIGARAWIADSRSHAMLVGMVPHLAASCVAGWALLRSRHVA